MKTLTLGRGLVLPVDFATEGVAIVGMRGSGKSNTEVRWAEVLYAAKIPFVAVDPKGDWGGIRSSADGKSPGLSVPVFGGLSADFPLEAHMGARIADLLVDENLSAVLDVSRLSITARARFLTEFFNQLMDRHQRAPHVRCVILEEAHRYIPQEVKNSTAALKEAAASILLEGRAFGLGCWAATQRPARLHKDVLEEVGTVILHRIGAAATNDLRTISGWVKHEDLSVEIVPSLTKLGNGECWVLAPSTLGVAQRAQIDRRTTFDSAATPLVGAGSRPNVTMADIDADVINQALSDVIERAKAMDPAQLTRRIKELERELARKPAEAEPVVKVVEVEVVPPAVLALAGRLEGELATLAEIEKASQQVEGAMRNVLLTLAALKEREPVRREASPSRSAVGHIGHSGSLTTTRPRPPIVDVSAEDAALAGDLTPYAATLLAALAKRHPIPMTIRQWSVAADRSTTSSAWDPAVRQLRTAGYVGQNGADWFVTAAGLDVAGVDVGTPPPSGAELVDWWCNRITGQGAGAARTALRILAANEPITVDELADLAGWSRTSSGPGGAVNTLMKLDLAERRDGVIYIDENFR